MIAFAQRFARRLFCLPVLLACAVVPPQQAAGVEPDACETRWPENRLIVGTDLQARRFMLEAQGGSELTPPFPDAGLRMIYHRTFILSLDIAEPVALFKTDAPRTVLVARDKERSAPLHMPVFFVGRSGESLDDVKADAERVAFAQSGWLHDGDDFAEVNFRLRRGGSLFGDIKPFFICGLPGILLCKGYCPGDTVTLAASLVNWAVKTPAAQASAPAKPQPVSPSPAPTAPKPPAAKPSEAAQTPEPSRERAPVTAHAPPPGPRLVLTFVRKSGEPVSAAEVLEAEESVRIEGVPLSLTPEGLSAELQEAVIQRAGNLEALQKLFPHHELTAVKVQESRFLLTAEPLYIRAASLAVRIVDAAGEPVPGCDLALDVAQNRRLGRGWAEAMSRERTRGLPFAQAGAEYVLNLPGDLERSGLLIGTAGTGEAARLSNAVSECSLEARPLVTVEELRSGKIVRSLRQTGPLLIALLSTDSNFSSALGVSAAEGFWSHTLGLVNTVSGGPWERKILARAQSFGIPETGLLQDAGVEGKLAGESERNTALKMMLEGSRLKPEPLTIFVSKPVQHIYLDLALGLIRKDAHIAPRDSAGQEALLLIAGSLQSAASSFCQQLPGSYGAGRTGPQWVKQARKIFVLEVWSDAAAGELEKTGRAKPATGAQQGIYSCGFSLPGSNKFVLYALLPKALSEGARASTFEYLAAQAGSFLKP
ncbi:MAG: hypothetical protein HY765_10170 [Rhodomicrobium sp.]|nr:hypothetical protein [Rhodomicrobium sp.]